MKNKYEIRGDIAAIFLNRRNGEVIEAIIDTDTLEIAKSIEWTWYARLDTRTKSAYVYTANRARKFQLALHRLLTNAAKGFEVDHINRNTLDNRMCNLRVVTREQNQQNLGVCAVNTSGVRNVTWHKVDKKWQVTVGANKRKHYIGKFDRLEDAEKAAIEARKRLHIS